MKTRSTIPSPDAAVYLYDIPGACRALGGIGRSWLYEQIKDGRLRPVKLGARTMIPASEIERLLADVREAA